MPEKYFVPNCPKCGSKDVAEHIYGDSDDILIKELEADGHKFILKGCIVDYGEIHEITSAEDDGLKDDDENDNRTYACNACSNEYSWRDWRASQLK